uniref:Uncharacterized protein n=1 Tax=Clastoptera arizonana TaxID=38151 RepID=A0A1B6CT88_9HEMI
MFVWWDIIKSFLCINQNRYIFKEGQWPMIDHDGDNFCFCCNCRSSTGTPSEVWARPTIVTSGPIIEYCLMCTQETKDFIPTRPVSSESKVQRECKIMQRIKSRMQASVIK